MTGHVRSGSGTGRIRLLAGRRSNGLSIQTGVRMNATSSRAYLNHGVLGRLYMGYSTCRVCGKKDNGDSEYSDGTYVWPSGFAHYVLEHQVRPPDEFVQHAINMTTALEGERDESWWRGFAG